MAFNYVIVCHSGAGNHSISKENIYKSVCKRACKAAQVVLKDRSVSVPELIRAAVEAVKVLENDPCTNAGFGSNLTINGKLQCDAAIMCGQSLRFGAVGCLSNIENPILVAEKLLIMQMDETFLAQGRYPPSILVGRDATEWAINNKIKYVDEEKLITVERLKKYEKYKILLEQNTARTKRKINENENSTKKPKLIDNDAYKKEPSILDTVGVIIADSHGRVVSATSSGGIFLKQDGRLGQSCMYGCGCYSEQKDNGISVTAVSTGLGEQLMRTMLPIRTCEAVSSWSIDSEESFHEKFQTFLNANFMNSAFLSGDVHKSFGILCLRRELIQQNRVSIDLLFGHSTPSLCFAYLSSQDDVPQTIMSRKADENTKFVIGSMGTVFNF